MVLFPLATSHSGYNHWYGDKMNEESRLLIIAWINRAKEQDDPFIKFFILYMCIDAWITSESSLDGDGERLAWLVETDNLLRSCWHNSTEKKECLNTLKAIGKVEDMRPSHRGEYKYLNDITSLKQVMRFIHQVRCNLFHGGKSPTNVHDEQLVSASAELLFIWLNVALNYKEPLTQGTEIAAS